MEDGDWNAPRFRLNRVIPLNDDQALVQWVETGVDLAKRWPWQHTAVCSSSTAIAEVEMSSTIRSYQQVLDHANKASTRDITIEDIEVLTEAPTLYYPGLQGQGGWW